MFLWIYSNKDPLNPLYPRPELISGYYVGPISFRLNVVIQSLLLLLLSFISKSLYLLTELSTFLPFVDK